jgi:murein DD-endopeptidase MepM/ murein hydrolase activator NlpD
MPLKFFLAIASVLLFLATQAKPYAFPLYTSPNASKPADLLYGKQWNDRQLNYKISKAQNQKLLTFQLTQNDTSDFVFPIKTHGKVISKYGWRSSGFHTGTDYKLNHGDTVVSAFSGKVRMAKWFSGYGYVVVVRHHNGLETVYSHLSKILVGIEENVKAGTPVGLGGATGRATTSHLHFEMRILGIHFNSELLIDYKRRQLKSNVVYYLNESISPQYSILKSHSTFDKTIKIQPRAVSSPN